VKNWFNSLCKRFLLYNARGISVFLYIVTQSNFDFTFALGEKDYIFS